MLSLTAVSSGAAIRVTWNTPVDDVAVHHYEVMYVVPQHPAAGKTVNSTIEIHVITGLVQGVVYNVSVRAVSEVGGHAGEYSEVESITTPVGEKCSFLIWSGRLSTLTSLLHNHPSNMKLQCIHHSITQMCLYPPLMWSLLVKISFLLSGHLLLKDPLSLTLSHGLLAE